VDPPDPHSKTDIEGRRYEVSQRIAGNVIHGHPAVRRSRPRKVVAIQSRPSARVSFGAALPPT